MKNDREIALGFLGIGHLPLATGYWSLNLHLSDKRLRSSDFQLPTNL